MKVNTKSEPLPNSVTKPPRKEPPLAVASRWVIRELQGSDVKAYVRLRHEALLDSPLAFVASPGDDRFSSMASVREELRCVPESVIIGAFRPRLCGAVGLYRDRYLKSSHKVHLWGLYVTPNHRRQGIAFELLTAVLRHAAALPGVSRVHLKVSAATPGAQRLYERAGFRVWGTEPAGARYDGQTLADHHMALSLQPDAD